MSPRWSIVPLSLALLRCGGESVSADDAGDAGRVDRPVVERVVPGADTDGDGLCDETETQRRTDPRSVDTDGDGLMDLLELRYGSDPLNGRDPASADRLSLVEGREGAVTVEHYLDWQGMGEVMTALAQDRSRGLDDRAGSEVAAFEITAVGASPAVFVREVNGPRFIGVTGRTVLHWTVSTRPRPDALVNANAPARLGCRRAYEALVTVKREGGEVVQLRRLVIDVAPPAGMDAGTARWPRVSADGFCLPARCQ